MDILWAILLLLIIAFAWFLNVLGMPGNWMIVGVAVLYAALAPAAGRLAIGWWVVLACLGLAIVGEIVEFAMGAVRTRQAGGSRTSALFALCGALAGALLGMLVGLPIPVIGSVIAAVLFAAIGAFAGAAYGESITGKPWQQSWQVGKAAFVGRLLGTLGKVMIGAVMVALLVAALVF